MKMADTSSNWEHDTKGSATLRSGHRLVTAARQSGADTTSDDCAAEPRGAGPWRMAASWNAPGLPNANAPILVWVVAGFHIVFLVTYGLFLLAIPELWHGSLPVVADTGIFNHLIRSIGIIQLLAGLAFGVGLRRPDYRTVLWTTTSLWLGAHAGLHLWEGMIGIFAPGAIVLDIPTVYLPAIVSAFLAIWAIKSASSRRKRAIAAWRGRALPFFSR